MAATNRNAVGIAHLTVVPRNFEPAEPATEEVADADDEREDG